MEDINKLTHQIIGCAMQVHNVLGNGFHEEIYQRALGIELINKGIAFIQEQEMSIFYKGESIGSRKVDFLIEDVLLVEVKALEGLLPIHKSQAINFLEAYNVPHGLLLNFGNLALDFKRVYNKKLVKVGM